MSLSNPRTQSPVRKYFRVRSSTGDVVYYDKTAAQEVVVDTPFKFIVLDVLTTIGGFNEPSNSGIWSNEVRSNDDILTVRTKNGVLAKGSYNAIKDKIKADGGKFGNSVYIAYHEDGELALGNINFVGSAVSAWFDFKRGRHLDHDPGVAIVGFTAEKKGRTEYFVPTFQGLTVSPEQLSTAEALDQSLQAHLSGSLSQADEPVSEPEPAFAAPAQASFGAQGFDAEPPF